MLSKTSEIAILKRSLDKDGLSKQEYIRVNAVLLKKKGYTLKEIMDITDKAQVTIQNWITDYNKNGIDGLRTKEREVAPRAKLSNKQKDKIKQTITGHKPSEKGYFGDFWSVASLKRLIKDEYGVEYKSAKAYRELLHYCGFSYQKAEYIDRRKDSTAHGHFKKRFEKKLKKGVISMWW